MPPFPAGENPENDAARIEQLLRLGAHAILGGGEGGAGGGDAAGEDKGFAGEDIDQVCSKTFSNVQWEFQQATWHFESPVWLQDRQQHWLAPAWHVSSCRIVSAHMWIAVAQGHDAACMSWA
jgi:hypothetical protein